MIKNVSVDTKSTQETEKDEKEKNINEEKKEIEKFENEILDRFYYGNIK